MFEGKPPSAGGEFQPGLASGEQRDLRLVSWPDLVARLEAARELRTGLGAGEASGDASFDPESARHIAALSEAKPDVNFDHLGNGKSAAGIGRSHDSAAVSDDPRK